QSARLGKFPKEVHSRSALSIRERNDLVAAIHKEWVGNKDKRSNRLMLETRERLIELELGTGVDDRDLLIEGLSRRLHHTQLHSRVRIFRIYEDRKTRTARDQLTQNLDPFGFSFSNKKVDTCRIAARSIEACDQPQLYRVPADHEHERDRA